MSEEIMGDTSAAVDLWPMVPRLLAANRYCVLATADGGGVPWATPVFFAARQERELFWVSSPRSRHSRNIEVRPTVGISVFDSTVPIGGAEALYLEARAGAVAAGQEADGLGVLNAKLGPGHALTPEDLRPAGPLQLYRAVVTHHDVLIRGGDARFDNVVDQRLPVQPREPDRSP